MRLNQGYLLKRYIRLESPDAVWEKICIPILSAIFSAEHIFLMFESSVRDTFSIVREINLKELFTMGESILIILGLALLASCFLFLLLALLNSIGFFASVTRNIDSTIKENELKMIFAILLLHGVFLDKDKECHIAESYFIKR